MAAALNNLCEAMSDTAIVLPAPPTPCPLLRLSDDVLEVVGHQISDALRPGVACALAGCCRNLWRVMRVPLTTLQPRYLAALALVSELGTHTSAELRAATRLHWFHKNYSTAHMDTLAMLLSTGALPRVETLELTMPSVTETTAWVPLFDGLGCGAAPRLRTLLLRGTGMGMPGDFAPLAAALTRGALPNLDALDIHGAVLGGDGLAALAVPLRQRPALKRLMLRNNRIGEFVVRLVGNLGAKELKQLQVLNLFGSSVGEAGRAALLAAVSGGSLPALARLSCAGL